MARRRAGLALAALAALAAAGCTVPVPPGAQLELLAPPDGAVTGPRPVVVARAVAWGPGFRYESWQERGWLIALGPLAARLEVDGRPVARLTGAAWHRLALGPLPPGRHRIELRAGPLRAAAAITVTAAPPVRFVRARLPAPGVPDALGTLLDRETAARGAGGGDRRARSGPRVAYVVRTRAGDGWALRLLPLDPEAAGARLAAPPDLVVRPPAGLPLADPGVLALEPCGDGAFLVAHGSRDGEALVVRRLGTPPRWEVRVPLEALAERTGLVVPRPPYLERARCFGRHARVDVNAHEPGAQGISDTAAVLLGPEGRWRALRTTRPGRVEAGIGRARWTVLARGRVHEPPVALGDGRWWRVRADGALAPLDGDGPAVALPLPASSARWQAGRPWRSEDSGPRWETRSGWPPRIRVTLDAPEPDRETEYLALAGHAAGGAPDATKEERP
ncbi:MAG TPA: hypothetical protein ENK20_05920 [Chromatiales bacterium]|nr:hypothetical protein [Chromatiales bacterium]